MRNLFTSLPTLRFSLNSRFMVVPILSSLVFIRLHKSRSKESVFKMVLFVLNFSNEQEMYLFCFLLLILFRTFTVATASVS